MSFTVSTISPEQQAQYDQGRSNAAANLGRGKAQNAYQQGLAQRSYTDNLRDFNTQQGRVREGLPSEYIQRGVFNSGIYRNALRNYAMDRLSGQRRLQNNYQNQAAGLTMQGRGYEDDYAETMSNLFGNQYAAQASIASALKGIM